MARAILTAFCFCLSFVLVAGAAHAQSQQVTLLDFSLPTCGPCRQMDPVVARLEAEGFRVQRIDGTRSPQVAEHFRVNKYPTFVILVGEDEVKRTQGIIPYLTLRQMLLAAAPRPAQTKETSATFASAATAGPNYVAPASPAVTPSNAPRSNPLLNASVRLKVQDASGHSFGTGTIVDARQGEALVLTCAHLFRDDKGQVLKDTQGITAELYESGSPGLRVVESVPVERILSCNFDSDVAFVSIRPRGSVRPLRIASRKDLLQQGTAVVSVGCDRGADPTVLSSQVTAINRYVGWPNVTTTGAPTVGRSGGGLFTPEGLVVGVCNNADYKENEGIYASLPAIHEELDKLSLSSIYSDAPQPGVLAAAPVAVSTDAMVPLPSPVVRGQGRGALDTLAGLSGPERAALEEIAQRAADSEVVCVIRPKTPEGRSQVLTLDRVSPEFVRALLAVYHEQAQGTTIR